MNLSKDEKQLLVRLLKNHREEIKHIENMPNQSPLWFSAEVKYEQFIDDLIKKLK